MIAPTRSGRCNPTTLNTYPPSANTPKFPCRSEPSPCANAVCVPLTGTNGKVGAGRSVPAVAVSVQPDTLSVSVPGVNCTASKSPLTSKFVGEQTVVVVGVVVVGVVVAGVVVAIVVVGVVVVVIVVVGVVIVVIVVVGVVVVDVVVIGVVVGVVVVIGVVVGVVVNVVVGVVVVGVVVGSVVVGSVVVDVVVVGVVVGVVVVGVVVVGVVVAVHVMPLPSNPALHMHVNDPSVLVQTAVVASQLFSPVLHSFSSTQNVELVKPASQMQK